MRTPTILLATGLLFAITALAAAEEPAADEEKGEPAEPPARWITYEGEKSDGGERAGAGKYIVFVTGDEEYRSEEGMPQLAKILAVHHGFRCTVLFALNPETGEINPDESSNIPGLEALEGADLMVIFTRFRDLPDDQMKHIVDYVEAGKPIVGLRTATHAFNISQYETYRRYSWRNPDWKGGFGRQVLGETWVAHHGHHGRESARGITAPGQKDHPILRGIAPATIWDPADVYTVRLPMLEGITPIVLGQVLAGMEPDSPPLAVESDDNGDPQPGKNNPMMPIAWIREWESHSGKPARVFATTLGSAPAFTQEGSRRLLVNACYWALGLEDQIPAASPVDLVGAYNPTMFGFGKFQRGIKPADHALPEERR